MSLSNPNSLVTEERLSEFYQGLLPYLGGNLPVMGDIDRSMIFDTTEKVVGKWTDGRPIYQKVVNFGTLPNATNKSVAHGISNFNAFVGIDGWCSDGTFYIPINHATEEITSNNFGIRVALDATYIYVYTAKNLSTYSGYFILRYTKTTDATNSFNYASENDYSTTEKVIGTWLDGKPIYQKTFTVSTPQCTSVGTFATTRTAIGATVDNIIDVDTYGNLNGICLNFKGSYMAPTQLNLTSNKISALYTFVNSNDASSNKNTIEFKNSDTQFNSAIFKVTLQYTKTS